MNNKIILIEGTDCTGKQTQAELLLKRLLQDNIMVHKAGFPMYDTPTGKIIAGPYLGKEKFGESYFLEGATNVNCKVAGLFYAADRYYNIDKLNNYLKSGHLILDRYVESNMAHQACKEPDKNKRYNLYKWFEKLEYGLLKLPKPDIKILLYLPRKLALSLKNNRTEKADSHERDENYLIMAEKSYLELAKLKKFKIINCVSNNKIKSINEISDEIYNYVIMKLRRKL